jgi:hypothetical protein
MGSGPASTVTQPACAGERPFLLTPTARPVRPARVPSFFSLFFYFILFFYQGEPAQKKNRTQDATSAAISNKTTPLNPCELIFDFLFLFPFSSFSLINVNTFKLET